MDQSYYQKRYQDFRIRIFKIFGGVQMTLGFICTFLSIFGIAMDSADMSKDCDRSFRSMGYYNYGRCYDRKNAPMLLAFDITCLLFSGWCIMTGLLPFCMNERREKKWGCLKTAFMVCSIIGSVIFTPTIFFMGIFGTVFRASGENSDVAILPAVLAFFGLVELIVGIVAASYCCCCWTSKPRVYPIFINEAGQPFVVVNNSQWAEIGAQSVGTSGQTLVPLQGSSYPIMNQFVPLGQQMAQPYDTGSTNQQLPVTQQQQPMTQQQQPMTQQQLLMMQRQQYTAKQQGQPLIPQQQQTLLCGQQPQPLLSFYPHTQQQISQPQIPAGMINTSIVSQATEKASSD